VRAAGGDDAMVAAAHLHDVVEDTSVTIDHVRDEFGDDVAALVLGMTDQVPLSFGNRKARKRAESDRLGASDGRAQTIKLADIRYLAPLLVRGDDGLRRKAAELLGGIPTLKRKKRRRPLTTRPPRPNLGTSTQGIVPSDLRMETTMTTYTISDHGEITTGLGAVDAAEILLTDDGYEYEMRADADGGYTLYVSPHSRNSTLGGTPMVRSVIYTLEADEELAARDIAEAVIRSGRWEKGELNCMTDEAHAAMLAEIAADADMED